MIAVYNCNVYYVLSSPPLMKMLSKIKAIFPWGDFFKQDIGNTQQVFVVCKKDDLCKINIQKRVLLSTTVEYRTIKNKEDQTMKASLIKVLAVLLIASMCLTACASSTTATTPAAEPAAEPATEAAVPEEVVEDDTVYTFQLGHAQSTTSPRHRSCEYFEKMVEEKTNGRIQVEVFPAGQLGNEAEMTQAVIMGTLQGVRGGDQNYVPKMESVALPFLCDDLTQIRKLCTSDYMANIVKDAEQNNLLVLALGDNSGFRQFTNNVRPIIAPEDMQGIKFRTTSVPVERFMKVFGVSTVSIPFTELYMSLKTGVCDGQENPVALIDSSKFYEVQKYCTVIDYMFFVEPFYVNLEWYNSLPEDLQVIMKECAEAMMVEDSRITDEENDAYKENIANNGVEVTYLTPEQKEAWMPLAEEVWKVAIEQGSLTRDELGQMLEIVGKTIDW